MRSSFDSIDKAPSLFVLDLTLQHIFGGEQYDLIIVDNAGFDQYTLNHNDFDNSDAYILVYAIDDRQRSFSPLRLLLTTLRLRFQLRHGAEDSREDPLYQCRDQVKSFD